MSKRITSSILLAILISAFLFASTSFTGQREPAYASPDERSQWISWASKAWRYFQPDVGVTRSTGLSHAGYGWPYFTDWDLGTYILAILDAERIGILPREGDWGSTYRLDMIVNFLLTRTLTSYSTSYLWYSSNTGDPWGSDETNVSDLGFLLIALHRLRTQRPEYTEAINQMLAREDITRFASNADMWGAAGGVYKWYVAHGFKFFGFDTYPPVIDALNTLQAILSGPQLVTYDVILPVADITSEPLLLASFTLDTDLDFETLVLRAYLAQQSRYVATGNFTGFSEGNTDLSDPSYIYEWIVRSSGQTWSIWPLDITPIIYIKVGFGFYALFGTRYALDMINHVNGTFTDWTNGYRDGVDENERVVTNIIDRTQGITLAAARYALTVTLGGAEVSTSLTVGVQPAQPKTNQAISITGRLTGEYLELSGGVRNKQIHVTTDWGIDTYATTNNDGYFTVPTNAPPTEGTYSLQASFAGDEHFQPCDASATANIIALIPTTLELRAGGRYYWGMVSGRQIWGVLFWINGHLLADTAGIQGKQITIQIFQGSTLKFQTSVLTGTNGVLSLNLNMRGWGHGTYTIVATFAGDSQYASSSNSATVSV